MIDTSFWKAGEIQLSFLANIDKAYCDEGKAVFLCLMQKKKPRIRLNLRLLAEMVGILPRAKQQARRADCLRSADRRPVLIRTIFAAKKAPA